MTLVSFTWIPVKVSQYRSNIRCPSKKTPIKLKLFLLLVKVVKKLIITGISTLQAEIVAGRKICGKKMLQGKSRNFRNFFFGNNIIFSQFASFSSRSVYSKGSNRRHPALGLLIFWFHPPVYYFFRICSSQFFFSSFTLTDTHARYYQILLIFLSLIVVWGQFLYSEVRYTQFQVGCSNSTLSVFPPSLSNFSTGSFYAPSGLLSIWVNSKPPVYSLSRPVYQSPQSMNFGRILFSFLLICIQYKIRNNCKHFYHFLFHIQTTLLSLCSA